MEIMETRESPTFSLLNAGLRPWISSKLCCQTSGNSWWNFRKSRLEMGGFLKGKPWSGIFVNLANWKMGAFGSACWWWWLRKCFVFLVWIETPSALICQCYRLMMVEKLIYISVLIARDPSVFHQRFSMGKAFFNRQFVALTSQSLQQ